MFSIMGLPNRKESFFHLFYLERGRSKYIHVFRERIHKVTVNHFINEMDSTAARAVALARVLTR